MIILSDMIEKYKTPKDFFTFIDERLTDNYIKELENDRIVHFSPLKIDGNCEYVENTKGNFSTISLSLNDNEIKRKIRKEKLDKLNKINN